MTAENLNEVKSELKRFEKRLIEAIVKSKADKYFFSQGCKETGALKRAAMDLKNELTKLSK